MTFRAFRWLALLALFALLVASAMLARQGIPYASPLGLFTVVAIVVGLLAWGVVRLFRRLLWRVGRRLAFSYFLIGALPIPMVVGLLLLSLYALAGFFAGHLYRDAVAGLRQDLAAAGELQLATDGATELPKDFALARFANGGKSGDRRVGAAWPAWLAENDAAGAREGEALAALADGTLTVAVAVGAEKGGAVIFYTADLATELTRRAGIWIELPRVGEPNEARGITIQVAGRSFSLSRPDSAGGKARLEYFERQSGGSTAQLDRPMLLWAEVPSAIRRLGDGRPVEEPLAALLNTTPRQMIKHLYSGEAEVDAAAWAALAALAILLLEIYAVAVIMAGYMIFGLSRATNHLYTATQRVQAGDFTVRIPVKRKDQLGELQRSYNRMAENLEELVAAAAQKEILEKELSLARELQRSLLPTDLGPATSEPAGGVRFATFFEPSAAIGGDYFDVLRLDRDRLVVVIADVSGHGLPAGLRMAMVKAGLVILVEEEGDPQRILERLHRLVRGERSVAGSPGRTLVTATLGFVDLAAGTLRLINAAHPPTYLVRDGKVREILIQGAPLGGLGGTYGRETVALETDDVLVWLSDGLIEATNPAGDQFGYARVARALGGSPADATAARDRLLAAVHAWTAGETVEDDRTLVVMHYRKPAERTALPAAELAAATTVPGSGDGAGTAAPSVE